jgi:L-fuculose-phosphate aldolase
VAVYCNNKDSREQVIAGLQRLVASGMTSGSSGNVSVRAEAGMLITPTGMPPKDLLPEHIVFMQLDGAVVDDQLTPSSEWRMHADVYSNKPDLQAIVHCHSNYATILACAHRAIPAQHYMIAASGNYEIPLADYATFGSQQLSDAVLVALGSSLACLMANHGQIATGFNLDGALKLAELVEELAHWHWGALSIGGPKLLSEQQMDEVMTAFASYGQQKTQPDQTSGH